MSIPSLKGLLTGPVPTRIIPAELLRPSFYGMLMVYYFCMALYGLTASLFGIVSMSATTSDHFTFIWSLFVAVVGSAAGLGVLLSRKLKKEWVEVVATSLVVGLMSGYGVAIVTRSVATAHWTNIASAWLPLLISILPFWRLAMIAIEGDLFKKRRNKGA